MCYSWLVRLVLHAMKLGFWMPTIGVLNIPVAQRLPTIDIVVVVTGPEYVVFEELK